MPENDTLTYSNWGGSGGAYIKSGSGALVAPVHLPHGALVTSVKAYYYDIAATANIILRLYDLDMATGGYNLLSSAASPGNSGYVNTTDLTIGNATVDNVNRGYLVQATSVSWSSDLKIMGVVITYTVN